MVQSRWSIFFCAVALAAGSNTNTCPAAWSKQTQPGKCIWPFQQQYKNISVAGAADQPSACCAACASDPICQEWLVHEGGSYNVPAGTCILNKAVVKGNATQDKEFACSSGLRPPVTWPPTPAPKPAPKGAKNVLFFAVDDLRPEILAFGGIPGTVQPAMHTPNLDKLANRSLVLLKNYVQQAVCSPTRASLLTGRRPDRTRTYDLEVYFRQVAANYTTIPEFFKQNGYYTVGMGKLFHPGHASGNNDDGCCSWSNSSEYFHAPNLQYWSTTGNNHNSWMAVPPSMEKAKPLPDTQTADHAVQTIARLSADSEMFADAEPMATPKPWFLGVGFHKPHLPFVAPKRFFDFYPETSVQLPPDQQPPAGMPSVAWSAYGELRNYADQAALNQTGAAGTVLPKDDVLALRRAYYASVSYTDSLVGKVLDALAASPFADNTIVSIWGDHGWQLGEHGEWCKHTNFEFATRAPMMVYVPGLTDVAPGGVRTHMYSEHVDLFPTLTEAATGIRLPFCPKGNASFDVPLCTEGSSLVPLMQDPTTPVKTASFSQYPRGYQKPKAAPAGGGIVAVVEDLNVNNVDEDLDTGAPSMSPCIRPQTTSMKGCTMGYTLVTTYSEDGHEYRYTEWADFNTKGFVKTVNWDRNVGVELYNHTADPGENFNIAVTRKSEATVQKLAASLSKMLRAGPEASRV